MTALAIAVPLTPVARWYLLAWPGAVEWCLVVLVAFGISGRTIADRLLPANVIEYPAANSGRRRPVRVIAWAAVVLLFPVVKACLIDPLVQLWSFDWGPSRRTGAFDTVLITTYLLGPYLVGLLLYWLLRDALMRPDRLAVSLVVACGVGLLAYGSMGYLPSLLAGIL